MVKIIGTVSTAFTAKDGTEIVGMTVHVTEPIDTKRGQGEAADHFFLSQKKLNELNFTPAVGQQIEVYYNKFGKVGTLRLLSDVDDMVLDID